MKLSIRVYNDPVLRKKAEPIDQITPEIRKLAEDMLETCLDDYGLGLAAPQVGHSLRMFVFNPHKENSRDSKEGFPIVVINPKLSSPAPEKEVMAEGCFSLPGIYPEVERPLGICLEGIDLEGNPICLDLEGFEARIAMHENDHLNGVLTIDRMFDRKERRKLESALRRLDKRRKEELS